MLNKMSILLAAAAVTLSAGAANADYYSRTHHNRNNGAISINLGGIAFGYSDGYWDNGHRWHQWRHRRDHENYRNNSNYHDWNHDRDGDHGWQRR